MNKKIIASDVQYCTDHDPKYPHLCAGMTCQGPPPHTATVDGMQPVPVSQIQECYEKQYNIWTVRFTFPALFMDEYEKCILLLFKSIEERKQIKYSMTFKEYSKKKVMHYHMRIVTTYKTPEMLRKYLKSFFPENKSGNRFFATHKCYVNGILHDDSLCKSATYIAKEGHIVHKYGYSNKHIKELIAQSKKYNKMLRMPTHEKIIQIYELTDKSGTAKIVGAIIDFYDSLEKIPPKLHIVQEIIRKILYKISPGYRTSYRNTLTQLLTEFSSQ